MCIFDLFNAPQALRMQLHPEPIPSQIPHVPFPFQQDITVFPGLEPPRIYFFQPLFIGGLLQEIRYWSFPNSLDPLVPIPNNSLSASLLAFLVLVADTVQRLFEPGQVHLLLDRVVEQPMEEPIIRLALQPFVDQTAGHGQVGQNEEWGQEAGQGRVAHTQKLGKGNRR